jgi:hypothetical protein
MMHFEESYSDAAERCMEESGSTSRISVIDLTEYSILIIDCSYMLHLR